MRADRRAMRGKTAPWRRQSASIWVRPIPASRSWKGVRRKSSKTPIYTAEQQLQAAGTRADEIVKKPVEDAVSALRSAIAGDAIERIRQGIDALSQALTRFAAVAQSAGPPPGGGSGSSAGDDVVDAEFEEVNGAKRRRS